MSRYVFEGAVEDIFDALKDNALFELTYQYDGSYGSSDMREKWTRILMQKSFPEIWKDILYSGYLEEGLNADDIVFCMCPEKNRKNENLNRIYETVGYRAHGNEQPVFFIDSTLLSSRKEGALFTTKGVYRNDKGMIAYSPYMPVDIKENTKQIYIKDTLVFDYNGSKKVFMDMACLAHIVYIFTCIRHEPGSVSNIDGSSVKTADKVTDKGVGDDSFSAGTKIGCVVWAVIIFLIIKACAG